MSASKTRALMANVCLQGGLLHTTVLQKQRQIYKKTIRKREKINQNAIKVEYVANIADVVAGPLIFLQIIRHSRVVTLLRETSVVGE